MPKKEKQELLVQEYADEYPVLPLRDVVVFPHMVIPLFVGRANWFLSGLMVLVIFTYEAI